MAHTPSVQRQRDVHDLLPLAHLHLPEQLPFKQEHARVDGFAGPRNAGGGFAEYGSTARPTYALSDRARFDLATASTATYRRGVR